MKVLVIDDDAVCLEMTAELLRAEGYDPVVAVDGAEALQILSAGQVRLCVSDWEMPDLSGTELCRRIRAGAAPRYVYFILVTGRQSRADAIEGLRAGADDFVTKPFDAAERALRVNSGRRVLALEGRDLAILAMARLAASRDNETGGHLERTRLYCRALAEALINDPKFAGRVTPEFAELIFVTSPLHDIGKMGIPDSVLMKPDLLTDAEFRVMKTHTLIGAETLDAAVHEFPDAGFLRMARDIALSHHERWDGSGYPKGLSGEDIPLAGRIMAVADVFDALVSKRVYKEAFAFDAAVAIIRSGAGSHFDPEIVRVFLTMTDRFKLIYEAHRAEPNAAAIRPLAA